MRLLGKALTFDDVLLVPAFSQVLPKDTSLATTFSRNIRLNLQLVSAAMDTVTEARLAIAIAQEGGIGIVHKNLSAKEQAAQVAKVKQPGKSAVASVAAPAAAASAPVPQLSNDDKELLAKKKKAESEAMARIKEEADSLNKIKATNCEKAKANQALLDSGVRMAVTNAKGEREFLDDAARATEQRRIRTVMETNCK